MARFQIENIPSGLLFLLEKLAAADGVTLDDLIIGVLHEQLYGFPLRKTAPIVPTVPLAPPVVSCSA
jgi:hypothetical protein